MFANALLVLEMMYVPHGFNPWDYIGVILGLYMDDGKMETTV